MLVQLDQLCKPPRCLKTGLMTTVVDYGNAHRFETRRNKNPAWFFCGVELADLAEVLLIGTDCGTGLGRNLGTVVTFGVHGIIKKYDRPSALPKDYRGVLSNGEEKPAERVNNRDIAAYKYPVPGIDSEKRTFTFFRKRVFGGSFLSATTTTSTTTTHQKGPLGRRSVGLSARKCEFKSGAFSNPRCLFAVFATA